MTPLAATVPQAPAARPAKDKKTAHHARNNLLIMVSYLVDGAVLLLFCLLGTITWVPVVVYTLSGLAIAGAVYLLIVSGWTQRFKDPSIVIPHTIVSQVLQLASLALFPEVGFMFALLLFIVYSTLTLSVKVWQSALAWLIVTLGTAIVLTLSESPARIPDATLTEQLVAYAFFVITLWRCVWIGSFNSGMSQLLRKRGHELAALTAQVDQLAHSDELTGVMNRRSLLNALREELQRAERSRQPLCVALMDLDKFKSVNDRLGHLAGDKTLKVFANTLSQLTRKADRFGRYGGEEFLLVMTSTDLDTAEVPIDRMRAALLGADWASIAPGFGMTFSCGIASHRPGETLEAMLQRADDALYRAKREGRNCTRVD